MCFVIDFHIYRNMKWFRTAYGQVQNVTKRDSCVGTMGFLEAAGQLIKKVCEAWVDKKYALLM